MMSTGTRMSCNSPVNSTELFSHGHCVVHTPFSLYGIDVRLLDRVTLTEAYQVSCACGTTAGPPRGGAEGDSDLTTTSNQAYWECTAVTAATDLQHLFLCCLQHLSAACILVVSCPVLAAADAHLRCKTEPLS